MKNFTLILILVVLFSALLFAQTSYEVLGPQGGSAVGVVVDTASGYTYVSSGPGGFLRKAPGQPQFEIMNDGIDFGNYFPIGSGVAIPPDDPGYVLSSYWSTIFYSDDYGETWHMSNFLAQSSIGYLDFINDTTVFIIDGNLNLYKSIDKGVNWVSHNLSGQTDILNYMELDRAEQRIYLANSHSVLFSEDYGSTWNTLPYVFPYYISQVYAGQNSGKLYVSAADTVFVTADDGQTWEKYAIGSKTYGLCEDPSDPDVFYVGTLDMGVYRWDPIQGQMVHASSGLWEVTVSDTTYPIVTELQTYGSTLYASGYQTGIFRSDDGGNSWSRIGLPVECIRQIQVMEGSSEKLITGSLKGVQTFENQTWTNSDLYGAGLGYEVDVLKISPSRPDTMYVGGRPADPGDSRLMTSTDGGAHWDMTFYALGGGGISAVAVNPSKPNYVFIGVNDPGAVASAVYMSTDGGTTMENWGPVGGTEGWQVGAIGISPMDYIIYVVTHGNGDVNVSVDGGQSFQHLSNLPGSDHLINGIYFDELTSKIYVSGDGLYVSEDGGVNWTDITPQQNTGGYFSSLVLDPVQPGRLFAGSFGGGILRSDDGGLTWNRIASELPNQYIGALALSNDNNDLYIGTYGASLLKYHLPAAGLQQQEKIADSYELAQNYPNPFNPTTTIDYRIAKSGTATLKVFDILGQEVAILVDGFKNAGEYRLVFNAANLPSGVYFYELQSAGQRMTRKMILMR